ncbi:MULTISPECIES: HAMP domain-containing sensor histidine kinase [Streptacidiphilus]|uniref:Signal transduction histidine-protein kinase/phosphatase MprB n=1 Tax=Streptacidiphilus cavernicola TaxID=3342716 RepID=A0ABV6UVI5_9ACTN|nr:HAMP domain-containing sensor histidine kinase [Streptacidiphilus jeojiense]
MRRTLAGVALAVTSMVALSFLIPLALLVRTEARNRAVTAAEQRAAALAPVLALTADPNQLRQVVLGIDPTGRLSVQLPGGQAIGTGHAPAALLQQAQQQGETLAQNLPDGGWVYLQPVLLGQRRVAVVQEFVPKDALDRGVTASLSVMAVLALGLVLGSVVVSDRLASRVVKSSRGLSRAAHALGRGDLGTRVDPMGPPELYEAGQAFNAMVERIGELLAVERELVADLSHRMRTPLTALHLATERMAPTPDSARITAAVAQLESELHVVITTARTPLALGRGTGAGRPEQDAAVSCPAPEVVRRRGGFWATLAEQQDRRCLVEVTAEQAPIDLPEDEFAAVVDALVGNVFRHTDPGTDFAVRLVRAAQVVQLTVEDAGPGIPDPDDALVRGVSAAATGPASTGLGLDIARRAAAATRGTVEIGRSPMGGAQVSVTFGLAAPPGRGSLNRRRGRARRSHA